MSTRANGAWMCSRVSPRLATVTVLVAYDGRDMAQITGSYQDLSPTDCVALRMAMEKAARKTMAERVGLRSVVHVEVEDGVDEDPEPSRRDVEEAPTLAGVEA